MYYIKDFIDLQICINTYKSKDINFQQEIGYMETTKMLVSFSEISKSFSSSLGHSTWHPQLEVEI